MFGVVLPVSKGLPEVNKKMSEDFWSVSSLKQHSRWQLIYSAVVA